MADRSNQSAIESALKYIRRGWQVVPVPYRAKSPVLKNWQQLHILERQLLRFFPATPTNIGVLLGEPSRWLIDVDLDHLRALEIASRHLPVTGAVFGRRGKLRSHWLYYSSRPVATRQWRLPDRAMVVELRSTGGQTVFPGSTHPCGETIEWDCDGDPATIDPDELTARLAQLYAAVGTDLGLAKHPSSSTERSKGSSAPLSVVERARRYLAKVPPAISGQNGHGQTFHAACILVIGFGLGREQALAVLREWNTACQPPWSESELAHKVDDALATPGWRGHLLAGLKRVSTTNSNSAIERANRHAIEHRRRAHRRALA